MYSVPACAITKFGNVLFQQHLNPYGYYQALSSPSSTSFAIRLRPAPPLLLLTSVSFVLILVTDVFWSAFNPNWNGHHNQKIKSRQAPSCPKWTNQTRQLTQPQLIGFGRCIAGHQAQVRIACSIGRVESVINKRVVQRVYHT